MWHGASWNFIFWGLYFGLFLLLEIKLDLFKQGVSDYRINVRREGNTILLEHVPAGAESKPKK